MNSANLRRNVVPLERMLSAWLILLLSLPATASLDLNSAVVEHLDNGLTLIVLEDRNFPVVSVQSLYRVGSRNELTGTTGLAHFLEHLAFRSSTNFPDTGLVSSIYAEGGEWHGYTWTDETTYFATVPADNLELLLDIEADRMSRLTFSPDVIVAERGAVLAEMHMYENDPHAMLIDALLASVFTAHPYRNNTIGWESDVSRLTYADALGFYKQHYHPSNAVLVIVGDVEAAAAVEAVRMRFGEFAARPATPLPHTVEPPQSGVRRVRIHTGMDTSQFMIAYRAPAATSADFAAFLVLQEILGSGSGVNFLQNDWGTPLTDHSLLSDTAQNMTTWFPPSAEDYLFVIGGHPLVGQSEAETEAAIETVISLLLESGTSAELVQQAIKRVQDELVFDVQTTEDAAHQLAFFAGLGGLEVLLSLPERVTQVSAGDVQRVARRYLAPSRRNIAWHARGAPPVRQNGIDRLEAVTRPPLKAADDVAVSPPQLHSLESGFPVIVQASDLSSTLSLKAVFQGRSVQLAGITNDDPMRGYSTMNFFGRPGALPDMLEKLTQALPALQQTEPLSLANDPATRLEQIFARYMSPPDQVRPPAPAVIVVSGDIAPTDTVRALDAAFGSVSRSEMPSPAHITPVVSGFSVEHLGRKIAQAQLGYIASVTGPGDPYADAYRLLLYIVSHDYEGRLGKAAISDSGLAYYIDAGYRTDGLNGWVTLAIGVDPEKTAALREVMQTVFAKLRENPPDRREIDEAKRHLLGRRRSAAQSNPEITDFLARDWLWYGKLMSVEEMASRLDSVRVDDVLTAINTFTSGAIVLVTE